MKTMIFLKNGLSKKGVEKIYLSNGINKGIANFRETIPLM
jgi:antitoxin component YwqK of YwqJK toxin-antitoxin module